MEFRKMVTTTLYARQHKRHRCIEQPIGLLWERRGGWFGRMALKHVQYHIRNESPVQVRCRIQNYSSKEPMLLFLLTLQLPSSVTGRQQALHSCLLTKQMDSMMFEDWILQLPFHISQKVFQKATKPGSAKKKTKKHTSGWTMVNMHYNLPY